MAKPESPFISKIQVLDRAYHSFLPDLVIRTSVHVLKVC